VRDTPEPRTSIRTCARLQINAGSEHPAKALIAELSAPIVELMNLDLVLIAVFLTGLPTSPVSSDMPAPVLCSFIAGFHSFTFRVLFVLVVLAHDRRRIVHFNVTDHPTADWTSQQLLEAFGDGKLPRFLIRDRDAVYGSTFRERVKALGIEEVVIAPRSPWQTPYVERVIGTLRRECLDHVIVLGEKHLRQTVRRFLSYYHASRCHLALEKDAPERRAVQPPEQGHVIEIPEVGGLHHRYERRAA
jgi:hypothetical protein